MEMLGDLPLEKKDFHIKVYDVFWFDAWFACSVCQKIMHLEVVVVLHLNILQIKDSFHKKKKKKKKIGHLFYTISSFVQHFKAIGEFKLDLQSGNAQFGSKSTHFFKPCDLEIWRMTIGHLF